MNCYFCTTTMCVTLCDITMYNTREDGESTMECSKARKQGGKTCIHNHVAARSLSVSTTTTVLS